MPGRVGPRSPAEWCALLARATVFEYRCHPTGTHLGEIDSRREIGVICFAEGHLVPVRVVHNSLTAKSPEDQTKPCKCLPVRSCRRGREPEQLPKKGDSGIGSSSGISNELMNRTMIMATSENEDKSDVDLSEGRTVVGPVPTKPKVVHRIVTMWCIV